jgi:hypothetical protein
MNYEAMSNLGLQEAGLRFAKKLREFESSMKADQRGALLNSPSAYPEVHDAYTQRFRADFRSDGQLIYRELLKRTGEKAESLVALDYGMLAGVCPVEDAANAIERLAKQLFTSPTN